MINPARRAKLQRELELDFIPGYDAVTVAVSRQADGLCAWAYRVPHRPHQAKALAPRSRDIESVLAGG
jgi:hypothetical protein